MIEQTMKAKEVKFLASNLDQASAIGFDWAFKLNNAVLPPKADISRLRMNVC
jgi:hypothetical protein